MDKLKVLDLFSGYTIREDGEVRSRFGRVIKPQISNSGYVRVELWSDGSGKKYLLHRLLATAFIPNPKDKPQVNHIDGEKTNNALANLEWVTQSENQKHAYATGLQRGFRVSGCKLSDSHKASLCGSRWRGTKRVYHAEGKRFDCPNKAAQHFGLNRQTFYNRANSERFPSWNIEIRREVK